MKLARLEDTIARFARRGIRGVEAITNATKSFTSGVATPDVVEARKAQCFAPCPRLVTSPDGKHYCGVCLCPKTRFSELEKKLTYAYLVCPLRRPGFSNAD